MYYSYMAYGIVSNFGYVPPNVDKYKKGLTRAYRKLYMDNTNPVTRIGSKVHTGINAAIERDVLPNPLNKKAQLGADGLKYMFEDKVSNLPGIKQFLDSEPYQPLTSTINGKTVAVGLRKTTPMSDNEAFIDVIGHPKYAGKTLPAAVEHIQSNPNTNYLATPLTDRHARVYQQAIQRGKVPNLKIRT